MRHDIVVNGDFWGFDPAELEPRVFGNVRANRSRFLTYWKKPSVQTPAGAGSIRSGNMRPGAPRSGSWSLSKGA